MLEIYTLVNLIYHLLSDKIKVGLTFIGSIFYNERILLEVTKPFMKMTNTSLSVFHLLLIASKETNASMEK